MSETDGDSGRNMLLVAETIASALSGVHPEGFSDWFDRENSWKETPLLRIAVALEEIAFTLKKLREEQ